jgi:hypothetical protein
VLDGEAVRLGVDGVSDFDGLMSRKHDDPVRPSADGQAKRLGAAAKSAWTIEGVWFKSKNPASEAVRREREEIWRARPAHGKEMHELGSINVVRLDRRTASRVTLPAHQAVYR